MKPTPFQYVIIGIFIALLLVGVGIFATLGAKDKSSQVGPVTIWGTLDEAEMHQLFVGLVGIDRAFQNVTYEQKRPESYESELVNAFASGRAPDLFFIDDSQVVAFRNKIAPIPYASASQRSYNDTFINEGAIFLTPEGILAIPIYVDPLVMYWNKDLFATAGLATYPRTWSEFASIAPKMTALDTASNVKRSAVALGSYDNVTHAKDIIAALMLQLGNPIVGFDNSGNYASVLNNGSTMTSVDSPGPAVLRFYTSFSNPSQSVYSWNRSLPSSFNAFASGDVGIYFGFASDYPLLLARNPNLSFGVAMLPQAGSAQNQTTYGRLVGLAMPLGAKNPTGASIIRQELASQQGSSQFTVALDLPPARRDAFSTVQPDPAQSVFWQSALIARGWLDPGESVSDPIFKTMVESAISGRQTLSEAVSAASTQLNDALKKN